MAPLIRSVRLEDTQKSGTLVRGGIANNGAMLRVDVFTKGGKFFAVPLYVADRVKKELPNRAVFQGKSENEWSIMDEAYTFLFSLHGNDWVRVLQKGKPVIEGYFHSVHRGTGNISLWSHDRNPKTGKQGFIEGIGIKTALSVEKLR